ncbi:FtsH protease activity modulator HflK [Altererythrobacter salegens]|uniref:Protein HflK n=1 Tax=Croceibacterium salegens TaxID=1737568 RepID=A0A6I4SW55_9SPHN|nr:FtsH protease activity modulator HflK [Croceibacterium salegens]MXO59016.1 FtsH protease activity modulator HflK [Croceibacterium salegens]
MAGKKSPWGNPAGGGDGEPEGNDGNEPRSEDKPRGPRNPWLPGGGSDRPRRSANIEDIFKHRGPEGPRRGGGGGSNFRLPQRPGGGSWFPVAIGAIALAWLAFSMMHQIQPKEQGIVTTFGKYSRTLQPGLNFTLPWPFQHVDVQPVSQIRIEQIPEGAAQRLMLTGDQNLVDLSYLVRWNIKDLKQFEFQLLDPESTVKEVGEAAMRASVAEEPLNRVLSGAGRADIELQVRNRMQQVLDAYRSGVAIQGVEIRKTDPPTEVEEAFKDVSAAQQEAESYVNQAEAVAQQVLARAQGDATAFNKVYEQYKLAPEVTRRRMYYDTMERVLRNTDKTVIEAPGVQAYLPLNELNRRAQTAPSNTPGGQ